MDFKEPRGLRTRSFLVGENAALVVAMPNHLGLNSGRVRASPPFEDFSGRFGYRYLIWCFFTVLRIGQRSTVPVDTVRFSYGMVRALLAAIVASIFRAIDNNLPSSPGRATI